MTDKNKTEIAIVLDRSGSMASIAGDMVGGFETFVAEQRKLPGECVLSLYQFDSKYDVVYEARPLADVPPLVLKPRDSTALYDAIGRTIIRLGERLAAKPEAERPGAVIAMIITDGCENASREFTFARVRDMIATQERDYNWRFAFLGSAGLRDAQALGINTVGTMAYDATTQGIGRMYAQSAKGVGNYRRAVSNGIVGQSLTIDPPEDDDPDLE